MRSTGHTVRRPQTDHHQERGYEPKHRCSDQRWNSSGFNDGNDGGDEDEDGSNRIMEELRQRPVDAGHLRLQSAQMHKEEDEEGDEEPEDHHLEVLEGIPVGPPTNTVDTQEGHQQGKYLSDLEQSRDGPGVAQVQGAFRRSDGRGRGGDDGVWHVDAKTAAKTAATNGKRTVRISL